MKKILLLIMISFALVNCKKENQQEITPLKNVSYKIVKAPNSDTLSGFLCITKTVNLFIVNFQITDTIVSKIHFNSNQSFNFEVASGCKINTILEMDSVGVINKPLHIISIDNGLQQLNSYDLNFNFYL